MVLSSTLLNALVLPMMALAQSYTACNPMKVDHCPADHALGSSFREDFHEESKYFSPAKEGDDRIKYTDEGVAISLNQRFDNPSLKSNFYIMFGKTEVIFKAAPGRGIVSSFYLQSDDLDEIDLEWVGSDNTEVQTNFFSKGDTTTYDRGAFHGVYEPQQNYHNYTIDWTEDTLTWYLDGAPLRTLSSDSPSGYPQTPMYIVMGIWAGGDPSNQPGTIEWAGGLADYSEAPFTMHVKSVVVSDYSSGTEYKYGDQSGKWSSIEATNGEVNGRVSQAEEEFDVLVAGGDVDNDFTPSERSSVSFDASAGSSSGPSSESSTSEPSSSSSSSESSTNGPSSSTEETSASDKETSSSDSPTSTKGNGSSNFSSSTDPGVISSKNRVSSVYTSSATSIVSRSSESSRRSQVVISSSASPQSSQSSHSSQLPSRETSANSSTLSSSSNGSPVDASSSAISSIQEVNSGHALISSIGEQGFRALFASIFMTSLILLA